MRIKAIFLYLWLRLRYFGLGKSKLTFASALDFSYLCNVNRMLS